MAITVGDRFVRRQDAARGSTANATAADVGYDTAVLSEGGFGVWGSDEVVVDTAGKYFYVGDLGQIDLTGVQRAVGTLVPVINGVTQEPVGLATHRYIRDAGGATEAASIGAGILDLSASDAVGVRNPGAILTIDAFGNYATDSGAGGALQLIRLPDNDFLHLERSTDQSIATSLIDSTRPWIDSSGSWTKITWPTEVSDAGNWHAASSGDVVLPANSKFLIVATTSCRSLNNNRQCFVTRLNINGVNVQTGTGYQRNLASEGPPAVLTYFHETGGSTETLYLDATMEEKTSTGATDQVVADAALQIMLLDAGTEWIHVDNGAADSLTTALAATGTWYETPLSATFRADGNSNLSLDSVNNAVQNDSGGTLAVLAVGWHRWDRDAVGNTARKVPWARFNNGGTQVGYGRGGAYSRGDESGWSTWQAHHCSIAMVDMAAAADLTCEVNDPVTGANSDMGIYASTNRHFLGMQVLDISSLTGSATQDVTPGLAQSLATASNPAITTGAADIGPSLAQSLAVAYDPTVTSTVDTSPALAQSLATTSDPTVTTGVVDVTPPVAQSLAGASDPTITTGAVNIAPPIAQSLATGNDPAITTGAVDIGPALAQSLAVGFDPTVDAGAATQDVTPDVAQSLATASDPVLVVDVSPGLAQSLATAYAPTVTTGAVTVTPGLSANLATAFDPTIATGVVDVTPSPATNLATVTDPVISTTVDITPGLVSQLATASDPTITAGVADVTPGLAAQLATTSDPVVALGAGTQNVTPVLATNLATSTDPALATTVDVAPDLAQSLAAASDPVITVDVTPGLAVNLATVFDPVVTTGGVTVAPELVSQLATVSDPAVTVDVTPGLATQLATAYAPTVTVGAATVAPELVSQLAAAYGPVVSTPSPFSGSVEHGAARTTVVTDSSSGIVQTVDHSAALTTVVAANVGGTVGVIDHDAGSAKVVEGGT